MLGGMSTSAAALPSYQLTKLRETSISYQNKETDYSVSYLAIERALSLEGQEPCFLDPAD